MLTEEETVQKREQIELLNRRIRRWLKYRIRRLHKQFRPKLDGSKNGWAVLLAKLSGVEQPLKARQAYQQFMCEQLEEITPIVKQHWLEEGVDGNSVQMKKDPTGPF
ncbi:hypothetical protein C8R43DRAFT_1128098 [Mycena crocata]|nr:hypothetical protein C8R43DRAFT_1128098 [Mycena crocata]